MAKEHWLDVDDMDEDALYEEAMALDDFDDDDDDFDDDDDEFEPIRRRPTRTDDDEWN